MSQKFWRWTTSDIAYATVADGGDECKMRACWPSNHTVLSTDAPLGL